MWIRRDPHQLEFTFEGERVAPIHLIGALIQALNRVLINALIKASGPVQGRSPAGCLDLRQAISARQAAPGCTRRKGRRRSKEGSRGRCADQNPRIHKHPGRLVSDDAPAANDGPFFCTSGNNGIFNRSVEKNIVNRNKMAILVIDSIVNFAKGDGLQRSI
jgi:hypothetical protein